MTSTFIKFWIPCTPLQADNKMPKRFFSNSNFSSITDPVSVKYLAGLIWKLKSKNTLVSQQRIASLNENKIIFVKSNDKWKENLSQ